MALKPKFKKGDRVIVVKVIDGDIDATEHLYKVGTVKEDYQLLDSNDTLTVNFRKQWYDFFEEELMPYKRGSKQKIKILYGGNNG